MKHIAKIEISPILSNRASISLLGKCKLGLLLEDRKEQKKKTWKRLGANEHKQAHVQLLC